MRLEISNMGSLDIVSHLGSVVTRVTSGHDTTTEHKK